MSPTTVELELAPFNLDRFEVTIQRFSAFIRAYNGIKAFSEDAGAPPGMPGTGWQSKWSSNPTLVAPNPDSLMKGMLGCGVSIADADRPDEPVTCVNWYVALAFCIWDGGRLPTEAEWAFAAFGGDQQRAYPWSTPFDASIDYRFACYRDANRPCEGLSPVGTHTAGRAFWSSLDLAGNAHEWVADRYRSDLVDRRCLGTIAARNAPNRSDCETFMDIGTRSLKGGSYALTMRDLLNAYRTYDDGSHKLDSIGFRCARDVR